MFQFKQLERRSLKKKKISYTYINFIYFTSILRQHSFNFLTISKNEPVKKFQTLLILTKKLRSSIKREPFIIYSSVMEKLLQKIVDNTESEIDNCKTISAT